MIAALVTLAAQIETVPATPHSAVDFTWLFVKMLLVLGIVCIVAILILKFAVPRVGFMKRLARGSFAKVLERQALEPRKHLYLVEIGGRYLVIGTSDHGISPIVELTRDEAAKLGVKGAGE